LSWLAPKSQAKTAKMPNVMAKKIPTSCSTPSLRASSLFLSLWSVDLLWLELPIGEFGTFIGFVLSSFWLNSVLVDTGPDCKGTVVTAGKGLFVQGQKALE
jgi:hypothetical protein